LTTFLYPIFGGTICHLIFGEKKKGRQVIVNDDTLQIINESKHQKKQGEYKEQNGSTHIQKVEGIT
jgi:hypothetical protein